MELGQALSVVTVSALLGISVFEFVMGLVKGAMRVHD